MIIATIAVKIYAQTAWRMLAVNHQPASTNRQSPSKQSTKRGHIRMTLTVICAALIISATAAALTFRSGTAAQMAAVTLAAGRIAHTGQHEKGDGLMYEDQEDIRRESARVTDFESGEGYDCEDFGGAFDGTRVISDADEGL